MVWLIALLALPAHALDRSVRSLVEADLKLRYEHPVAAVTCLESARDGVAAPLATLKLAMLRQQLLDGSPEATAAFVAAVHPLAGLSYDALWALAQAQPEARPSFDRQVVSRRIFADSAAALTLHAAVLLEASGDAGGANALRATIVETWPDSTDGRHLRASTASLLN